MKCALCQTKPRGEKSHIIPAFVYRWFKTTSPTGYMRDAASPNQRQQDGEKYPLLCEDCEDLFSGWEEPFARQVLHEIEAKAASLEFDYGDWLLRFCVSVSWRTLQHLVSNGELEDMDEPHPSNVRETLETWRRFLLGEGGIGIHAQHLVLLEPQIISKGVTGGRDLAIYMTRSVDFNTVYSPTESYIFSKLGAVMIAGVISNDETSIWNGTRVEESGRYKCEGRSVSGHLFFHLEQGIAAMRKSRELLSDRQNDKIGEAFKRRYPPGEREGGS